MVRTSWLLALWLSLPLRTEALVSSNVSSSLTEVTLLLARNISKYRSTLVVVESSLLPDANSYNTLVGGLLQSLKDTVAVQLSVGGRREQFWENFVIFVDSAEAFRNVRYQFPVNTNERTFYFLIILTRYTPEFHNVLQDIFETCYRFKVINVNVILDHPAFGVQMYTYTLFSEKSCRVIQPVLYLSFNQSYVHSKPVFPNKLTTFFGCPLRITAQISPPMLMFDGNRSRPKSVTNWRNLYGVEGMLVRVLADILNFTIEVLPFQMERTTISNSTAYGCFADLISEKADFAIGSLGLSDPYLWIISPSGIYHGSPYIYALRDVRSVRPITRLARPFSPRVWICLALLLTVGAIIIYILKSAKSTVRVFIFGERNVTPMLNFTAMFLGYPAHRTPTRNFARYLFFMWLSFSYILRNAYQGSMYDAIRLNNFARTPRGLKDLLDWKYTIMIHPDVDQLKIFDKFRESVLVSSNYLERYAIVENSTMKYATVTVQDTFTDYMAGAQRRGSNLFMINKVIFMYHMVMFFPKHSIYIRHIDDKLRSLIYSGIVTHIKKHYIIPPTVFTKSRDQQTPKPVKLNRLSAIFLIHAVVLSVACLVFGLELISTYSRRLRWVFERVL